MLALNFIPMGVLPMPKILLSFRWWGSTTIAALVGWAILGSAAGVAWAQTAENAEPVAERRGYLVDVPLPIGGASADRLLNQLEELAASVDAASRERVTVVLRFGGAEVADQPADGRGSTFADSVALARFLSGRDARMLRTVAYLKAPVQGHAVLVVLACGEIVAAPQGGLGNASADETDPDEALRLFYQSVAAGRGIVPEVAVRAMVDPAVELFRVTEVDGAQRFVDAEELATLRETGAAWNENQLSDGITAPIFTADQLREFRWASSIAQDESVLVERLGLARLVEPAEGLGENLAAVRLDVHGPITSARVRRFRSNIAAALDNNQVNSVLVDLDSAGGDLESSLQMAMALSQVGLSQGAAIGYLAGEARGDAALVALGCKPLLMHPNAVLGGPGAASIRAEDIADLRETIVALAEQTGRPAALLIGVLDPSAEVYRYTHRRTGQIGYFVGEPPGDRDQWQRDRRMELDKGLSASEAVSLGLAEGDADSLALAATRGGLEGMPPAIRDRGVVRAVEWLGGLPFLGPLLVFIGFMALSMEISAPGLGLPGFIALLCFLAFFWMRFLSGTAEWLEVVLFLGGVVCILIEVLVVPGVGVFGIGGLLMVVSAIVLTSQTFVLPENEYQVRQMTRSLLGVLAAFGGVVAGMIAFRVLLPGTPLFRHLILPGPNSDEMIEQEQREHLVRYEWLMGHQGVAVTPLRPAGKARFDDTVVAVISDGSPLSPGDDVRVIEVQGNRIVVEPV